MQIMREVKEFIQNNIELINENRFIELYDLAANEFLTTYPIRQLTEVLKSASIELLPFFNGELPPFYYTDAQSTILQLPSDITLVQPYGLSCMPHVEELRIPSTCKELGYEACVANKSLTKVTADEGLQTIRGACFRSCPNLKDIYLPESVIDMGILGMFNDCSRLLTVHCYKNSYVEKYCKDYGYNYKSY